MPYMDIHIQQEREALKNPDWILQLLGRCSYSWLPSVVMNDAVVMMKLFMPKYMKHLQRSFPWMKIPAMKVFC